MNKAPRNILIITKTGKEAVLGVFLESRYLLIAARR